MDVKFVSDFFQGSLVIGITIVREVLSAECTKLKCLEMGVVQLVLEE